MSDIILSSPLWAVFLTSLFPLSLKLLNKNKEYSPGLMSGIVVLGLFLAGLCLLYIRPLDGPVSFFSFHLVLNYFRFWAACALLIVTAFVVWLSPFHPQTELKNFSEILFLYLNALLGMIVLAWSNNLLTAFIGLELASFSFYILIALGRVGRAALTGAFKYFVLGSLASAVFLYGAAFIAGGGGGFDLSRILQTALELFSHSRLLLLGLIFIFVGFLFKVSVFPFQFWLPDVYRISFTPLLILMAGGMKISIFTALYHWTKNIFFASDLSVFLSALQWLAVLSVCFGNIAALREKDLKKMLLFSTIAHSGYLLMMLLSAGAGAPAAQALLYYLIVYAGLTMGAFLCLLPLEKKGSPAVLIDQLKGLGAQQPLFGILTTVFLLGLAGLPPTGGFMVKLLLFQNLVDRGFWWMLFWTVLGSAVGFGYYLKPLTRLYMESPAGESHFKKPGWMFYTAGLLLAAAVLAFGLLPIAGWLHV